ncbi:MAG: hypothetical protein HZB26_00545 [Candidatus Hydrogenedentes bacterium]|nr:hypothetical protein [Candidatus Hydrogenedentota bacterium]
MTLTNIIQTNLERLAELGIVALPYPERVDYNLHLPVRVQITHLPEEDGRVVEMSRRGFMRNGLVFRTAHVTVLKYSPKPVNTKKEDKA